MDVFSMVKGRFLSMGILQQEKIVVKDSEYLRKKLLDDLKIKITEELRNGDNEKLKETEFLLKKMDYIFHHFQDDKKFIQVLSIMKDVPAETIIKEMSTISEEIIIKEINTLINKKL